MATRKTGNAQLDEPVSQLLKLGKHKYAQVIVAVNDSKSEKTARQAVAVDLGYTLSALPTRTPAIHCDSGRFHLF